MSLPVALQAKMYKSLGQISGSPAPIQNVVADLEARRWRRFGHDRVYVQSADQVRVGWLDLKSGETVIEKPALRREFDVAIAAWREGEAARPQKHPLTAEVHLPALADGATIPGPSRPAPAEFFDLALNRPGVAAAEQVALRREFNPVRRVLSRFLDLPTEDRPWRLGVDGERQVAAQLERLGSGWHVLHAVPVGAKGADIDHVLIGPGGIFTINTKHHPEAQVWLGGDQLLVNGRATSYVHKARHEATRAGKLLASAAGKPVSVTSLIVIVGTEHVTVRDIPSDVRVVSRRRLVPLLETVPTVLDAAAVAGLFAVARRSDT